MGRRIGGAGGGSDPGTGKGAGVLVAVVAVGAMATTGGALGGAASTGGQAAAESVAGRDLGAKKAESKKAARKGDADAAWRRLTLRPLKKAAKQDTRCVAHAFGEVRKFLVRTPCVSLDRMLFGLADEKGNVIVVSVVWIGFRSRSDTQAFKRLDDVHGTGDITPLGGTLVDLADVHFTGHHYQSRLDGRVTVTAEAEAASGHVSDDMLDALADVSVWLPRP